MKLSIRSLVALGLLWTIFVTVLGCTHSHSPTSSDGRLNEIVKSYTEKLKRLDPFYAPYFNVEEDLGQFGDYASPAYFERTKALYANSLKTLEGLDPSGLSTSGRITYRLFKEDLETSLAGTNYPYEYLNFNQMSNRLRSYLDDTSQELTSFPFDSEKHYQDFINRAKGFPAYVENQIDLLRKGLQKGVVLNCEVSRTAPNSYKDGLITEIEKHPFWRPTQFMPKSISTSAQEQIRRSFRSMIETQILPGFQKLHKFYQTEYAPRCRKTYGIAKLPEARAWYAHAIRYSTGLNITPEEIHAKGLAEVRRISGELEKIKVSQGYKGSLESYLKSLSTDEKYYFKSSQEMFAEFQAVDQKVQARLSQYFSLIPKSPIQLVETSNPEDAAGAYNSPTEYLPYGRFIVNTKNLKSTAKYGVTTLMLHEASPGHHFHLALQFEMKDRLSEYQRKVYGSNAFTEGWALYAEYLGNEMGLFDDPMQRLGHLNDEMLRAVRLVVDTGIHHYGWNKKQVVNYMSKYLASDSKDIEVEANRYSVWPGQALGYKIGQLKILELRRWAEKELGPKFDIRAFHRVVLGNGTLSLSVLESEVQEWVAATGKNKIN